MASKRRAAPQSLPSSSSGISPYAWQAVTKPFGSCYGAFVAHLAVPRVVAFVALAACVAASAAANDGDTPPLDFQQIVPRGRIVSVDAPRFVSMSEAKLPPEAWVLGVVVDGQAKAYSLNLLNRYEVVNDAVGQKTFAAVW